MSDLRRVLGQQARTVAGRKRDPAGAAACQFLVGDEQIKKTIFTVPTLELIAQWADFARRDPAVRVHTLVSDGNRRTPIAKAIRGHIARVDDGHILFITHDGLVRVDEWGARASEYHLVMDEVIDPILTRPPFHMRFRITS